MPVDCVLPDPNQKDGYAIMDELYLLTSRMIEQRHDADFLTQSVEERQKIMDAFDEWAGQNPSGRDAFARDPKTRQTVGKILTMDKVIVKALDELKRETQKDASAAAAQQKVLGYLGNTMSASGSYMDVKLK